LAVCSGGKDYEVRGKRGIEGRGKVTLKPQCNADHQKTRELQIGGGRPFNTPSKEAKGGKK